MPPSARDEIAYAKQVVGDHRDMIDRLSKDDGAIEAVVSLSEMLVAAFRAGNCLWVCGNGGSAADAQHIAAEMNGRFLIERKPLPAVSLTTNTSCLTAIGNDYGFDEVFSRQVEGNGRKGDVLLGISTSGNSPNVVRAMRKSQEIGISAAALLGGKSGTAMDEVSDLSIHVPSHSTPRIQEGQELLYHLLCDLVEKRMFQEST